MNINTINCNAFFSETELDKTRLKVIEHLESVKQRTCLGSDFLGWLDLPNIEEQTLNKIETLAKQIQKYETVVIIGIGGSYLGAKAIIELFSSYFQKPKTEVIFAGQHLDDQYLYELIQHLKNKNFALIPISKSGTTLEPAVAFRFLLEQLISQFGNSEITNRVIPITDSEKGALRELANQYQLKNFIIPDNVGGRFSVLSPVGLLPIAIAGIDIRALLNGAKSGVQTYTNSSKENIAIQYATIRHLLYQKGYISELMVYSKPKFSAFAEWWKQLFGESEGKSQKGIYPSSIQVTTDLHSLGQFVQDGTPCLFETWVRFNESSISMKIKQNETNLDHLNLLKNKEIHFINTQAETGTIQAHKEGNVPIIEININQLNEFNIGKMILFYEIACAISALEFGLNPFDQPGVEAYKQNMFKLLGKN